MYFYVKIEIHNKLKKKALKAIENSEYVHFLPSVYGKIKSKNQLYKIITLYN